MSSPTFTRIFTGVIIGIVGIGSAVLSPGIAGFALLTLCVLLAAHELLTMSPARQNRPLVMTTAVMCVLGPLTAGFLPEYLALWCVAGILTPMLLVLFQPTRLATAFQEVTSAGFAFLYVGGLGTMATVLTCIPEYGSWALLSLIATSWASDTTAYFGGRFFGKSKLYEAVSPKKTWAGAWFGLAGAIGGVCIVNALFDSPLSWTAVILMGAVGGVAEQVGDLAESMLKRSAGVKDSGTLLPGHGGVLDRIDGMLYAAPVVFFFYAFPWFNI